MSRVPSALTDLLADAELAAFVEDSRSASQQSPRELGAAATRAGQRARIAARPPGPVMADVHDLTTQGGVPVRLYRPDTGPHPLLVFLHGGFWTIGDLESHDRACRRLALGAAVCVLAVDYRRAPEDPWPAAVDDVVHVVRWAAGDLPELPGANGPLLVAGDSAGGNLAALACLRLRDEGGPVPDAQVLVYPNTDLTLSQPSVREKGAGWGLAADDVAWGAEQWVPDAVRRADPAVSPLNAADLAGLPPALVITAEHDPLRDEGEAYAARLAAAGVPTTHRREPKMIHGFLTLDTVSPAAAAATDRLFADIARMITDRTAPTSLRASAGRCGPKCRTLSGVRLRS
ncbi:MAG TPA: alpha/beta hydrolase [Streptosporangiaceae bacterium]|nr:alpha/beta hydrolase [Streptosporangiaceae bacterium]